ncbi:Cap [Mouse associated cyclovirus 1]|uniref:Cap n=1 Tax=Mouse associated cyclovirus 1 TaxID=2169856 RepID=A0A1D8QQE8_9CIRC|nr:Cap [Mouse associated cyclovirus 1]AOW44154.1 Cap [Mouse associated cyclovirus 1]
MSGEEIELLKAEDRRVQRLRQAQINRARAFARGDHLRYGRGWKSGIKQSLIPTAVGAFGAYLAYFGHDYYRSSVHRYQAAAVRQAMARSRTRTVTRSRKRRSRRGRRRLRKRRHRRGGGNCFMTITRNLCYDCDTVELPITGGKAEWKVDLSTLAVGEAGSFDYIKFRVVKVTLVPNILAHPQFRDTTVGMKVPLCYAKAVLDDTIWDNNNADKLTSFLKMKAVDPFKVHVFKFKPRYQPVLDKEAFRRKFRTLPWMEIGDIVKLKGKFVGKIGIVNTDYNLGNLRELTSVGAAYVEKFGNTAVKLSFRAITRVTFTLMRSRRGM